VQCIPLAKEQFVKNALLPEYCQQCMLAKEVIVCFLFFLAKCKIVSSSRKLHFWMFLHFAKIMVEDRMYLLL